MPDTQPKPDPEKAGQSEPDGVEPRIGVYTCYCGGNIGDVVDVEKVAKDMAARPNVVVSRTDMSMCSDAGQAMIEEDIREHGLNRVVIGSCSPFLHEQTFRGTLVRAGLNPYLYQHVGIREQTSWVAHGDRPGATQKATRLMNAGLAKARHLEPLEPIRLPARQHALVVGGGVAGLKAALDIAERGLKVTLIERTPFLGGHMAQLEATFPADQPARNELAGLVDQVMAHRQVTVFTNTTVTGVTGAVGDFHITLSQIPRGVSGAGQGLEAALRACPVEIPDEFNYGLTKRKALYRRHEGSRPDAPAIDWTHCTLCGLCAQVHSSGIELDPTPHEFHIDVGAIVLATGFRPYEPAPGEYGYGEHDNVITLPQFIRLLALSKGGPLTFHGQPVRDLAMVHCVGSRQIEGLHAPQPDGKVNPYCSRVCCTATLHAALELKHNHPDVQVYDVYQDIRTYGRGHEDIYRQASEQGVRFLRYRPEEGPTVLHDEESRGAGLLVRLRDTLTWGEELDLPVDLVVLAVGMLPNPVDDLQDLLKVAAGSDRFLLEVHPKLRPVETAVNGVVLAGTAQSPMNIQESCASAEAAAAKVSALLWQGSVELEPFVAAVDLARCQGCGACTKACQYEGAIRLEQWEASDPEHKHAVVSPANCVGCGVCVGVCPNQAIRVLGWTLSQYRAMVEAIAAEIPAVEVPV